MPCPALPSPCPHLPALTQPNHSCSASAAWAATRHCTGNFTANPIFSSCLRAKATMMRALAGSSTRSSGPTKKWTPAPRQPETSLTSTPSVEAWSKVVGRVGKRLDLGSCGEAGWEKDEAILLRQRVMGAGLCSKIPSFFLSGWGFGNQDWGLLTTLLPASFSLSHLTPWPPGRPPSPASLSRCLFSSKESACPPQGPKPPHCHLGAFCGPHVSPSTSALSLILSHGDLGGRRARVPPAGPQHAHQGSVGEGRGSGAALPPLQGKAGHASVGLGTISPHRHQEAEAKTPARLRATETSGNLAAATLPSSSVSAGSDCCDQPCFKHVSSDPDSVLCGRMGGSVAGRT